jgi:pimeloyl-ACP methyl ester carboxylesterase
MGMTPLFFGDANAALFGAYHPTHATPGGMKKRVGVLLCYPAPQEYMFAHRAFRRLAELLAQRGHPVLRFDYSGTGDSAGDLERASLGRWRSDIVVAADELTEIAGVDQVSIIGMRLGASLAACVAAEGRRFRDVVLWDPIVFGRRAVDELRAIDARRYAMSHVDREPPPRDELCGFAFPAELRRDIDRLDLLQLPRLAATNVYLLTSTEGDRDAAALADHLRESGNKATLDVVADPEAIAKRSTLGESLLSRTMIDAVIARMAA